MGQGRCAGNRSGSTASEKQKGGGEQKWRFDGEYESVFCVLFFSCKLSTISDRQWCVLHQKVACATSSLRVLWGGGRKLCWWLASWNWLATVKYEFSKCNRESDFFFFFFPQISKKKSVKAFSEDRIQLFTSHWRPPVLISLTANLEKAFIFWLLRHATEMQQNNSLWLLKTPFYEDLLVWCVSSASDKFTGWC